MAAVALPTEVADPRLGYLSDLTVDEIARGRGVLTDEPAWLDAVALFIDVTGFTALSERMARLGPEGTEAVRNAIVALFDPLAALVRSYGGRVTAFAGDGMTVLFPYTARTEDAVSLRAVRCALGVEGVVAAVRLRDVPALTAKAGLARGRVCSLLVGDPARFVPVVFGPPLRHAGEAEDCASPGDVIIRDQDFPAAGLIRAGAPRRGFRSIAGVAPHTGRRAPWARPVLDGSAVVGAFIDPRLAARLGHVTFLGEHRLVTTMFASLPGEDPARIREVGAAWAAAIRRLDGALAQIDTDKRGVRFLVVFGALVQHEDDADRALRCALELRDLAGDCSIGIDCGVVYCGAVGATDWHDYGVCGDSVNGAARLAAKARAGQTLVSEAALARTQEPFTLGRRRTLAVKGKAAGMGTRPLLGREPSRFEARRRTRLPLVGRQRELGELDAALAGHGIVALVGAAGIGKTSLAARTVRRARNRGFLVCEGRCPTVGGRAYEVWRDICRTLLGLGDDPTPDEVRARLGPELALRAGLLAHVLDVPAAEDDLTRSLRERNLAAGALQDLLVTYVHRRARDQPVLLVLEDCQEIDPASLRLLEAVARAPVLVLLTYRPDGDLLDGLRALPGSREIRLEELSSDETLELVQAAVRRRGAEPGLAERIAAAARGNPLYVEELVDLVHDRGPAAGLEVPQRLQSLILARVDRLQERDRAVLKVASVAGASFDAALLRGCYPGLGPERDVERALAGLARRDLTAPGPHGSYLFHHALVGEAVYASLAVATREELHEGTATHIEAIAGSDGSETVLAHHWGRTQRVDKQREYFRLAGEAERRRYANESALGYYERLLPLLPEPEQAEVLVRTGEVRQLMGDWRGAEESYRRAGDEAALGVLLSHTESFDEALVTLEKTSRHTADAEARGRTLEALAHTLCRVGRYREARKVADEHLVLATEAADSRGITAALDNLGLIAWREGDHAAAARDLGRALAEATESGDLVRVVHASNDLAGVHLDAGDDADALDELSRAVEVADRIGYRHAAGFLTTNAGEIYRRRGEYGRALDCYARALDVMLELGIASEAAQVIGNAGAAAAGVGRLDDAETLLREAIARSRALDAAPDLAEQVDRLADLLAAPRRAPDGEPRAACDALDSILAAVSGGRTRDPPGARPRRRTEDGGNDTKGGRK